MGDENDAKVRLRPCPKRRLAGILSYSCLSVLISRQVEASLSRDRPTELKHRSIRKLTTFSREHYRIPIRGGAESKSDDDSDEEPSIISSPFLSSFQEEVHEIVSTYRAEVRRTFRQLQREMQRVTWQGEANDEQISLNGQQHEQLDDNVESTPTDSKDDDSVIDEGVALDSSEGVDENPLIGSAFDMENDGHRERIDIFKDLPSDDDRDPSHEPDYVVGDANEEEGQVPARLSVGSSTNGNLGLENKSARKKGKKRKKEKKKKRTRLSTSTVGATAVEASKPLSETFTTADDDESAHRRDDASNWNGLTRGKWGGGNDSASSFFDQLQLVRSLVFAMFVVVVYAVINFLFRILAAFARKP